MKKQVMTAAWAIAKEAAAKHGGSSKQYISAAMKQAWAQVQAPVEEVAAVEVEVAVVEAAPKAKKAPKKKAPKKASGMDFAKWMRGITEHYQVEGAPTVEAPKAPKQKIERKTETAAEKRARRAANPEVYAAPTKKASKSGGMDFAKWMRDITENY